jgi:predicted O-methyltransferase YrrM
MDLSTFIADLRLAEMYDGVAIQDHLDLQGWNSTHPVFEHVISTLKPTSIIEVGSWKGASATHMVGLLKKYGIDGKIVCVDTWMGGPDTWSTKADREIFFPRGGQFPILQLFLSNIIKQGLQSSIFPMVSASHYGGLAMTRLGLQVDAIYVDASHEEADVYADLHLYWDVVRPGGILFGDDYSSSWPGVIKAVNHFGADKGRMVHSYPDGGKFLFHK